jgi:hypothetical protein
MERQYNYIWPVLNTTEEKNSIHWWCHILSSRTPVETYKYAIGLLIFAQIMRNGTYIIRHVFVRLIQKLTAIVPVLLVLEQTRFQFTMEHFEVMVVGNVLHARKREGRGESCLCMKCLTTDNSLTLAMTFVA